MSAVLDLLADDDPAGLHHSDVGQSRPPGRGPALVLLQELLYRVRVLLLLRLQRLILHRRRRRLVRRRRRRRGARAAVLHLEDPVRLRRLLPACVDDGHRTLASVVQVDGRVGRAVPDERAPVAADLLAELEDDRRVAEGLVVLLRLDVLVQVALVQGVVAAGRRARAGLELELTLRAVLLRQTLGI